MPSSQPEPPSCVYTDLATRAKVYVGGKKHAKDREWLAGHGICHVETCLDHSLLSEGFTLPEGIGSHQFNIGYDVGRIESFRKALQCIQDAIAKGHHVLLHCEAGVHRAATAAALCLMFIRRTSFSQACLSVAQHRYVEIDRAVLPRYCKCQGRRTAGWMPWIRLLEQEALSAVATLVQGQGRCQPAGRAHGGAGAPIQHELSATRHIHGPTPAPCVHKYICTYVCTCMHVCMHVRTYMRIFSRT